MSITNLIQDGNLTIVQGISGIRFFEESWVSERAKPELKKRKESEDGRPKSEVHRSQQQK